MSLGWSVLLIARIPTDTNVHTGSFLRIILKTIPIILGFVSFVKRIEFVL